MASVRRFEDLEAWQLGRRLANLVYDLTKTGPFAKDYGLRDQIQRAAVSVMSNIAEGFESRTQAVFIDLLGRAKGSAGEVRSQLYIALDRQYITEEQFRAAVDVATNASRKIAGLVAYLESRPNARRIAESGIEYELAGS